jgi:hypothetical protein
MGRHHKAPEPNGARISESASTADAYSILLGVPQGPQEGLAQLCAAFAESTGDSSFAGAAGMLRADGPIGRPPREIPQGWIDGALDLMATGVSAKVAARNIASVIGGADERSNREALERRLKRFP